MRFIYLAILVVLGIAICGADEGLPVVATHEVEAPTAANIQFMMTDEDDDAVDIYEQEENMRLYDAGDSAVETAPVRQLKKKRSFQPVMPKKAAVMMPMVQSKKGGYGGYSGYSGHAGYSQYGGGHGGRGFYRRALKEYVPPVKSVAVKVASKPVAVPGDSYVPVRQTYFEASKKASTPYAYTPAHESHLYANDVTLRYLGAKHSRSYGGKGLAVQRPVIMKVPVPVRPSKKGGYSSYGYGGY